MWVLPLGSAAGVHLLVNRGAGQGLPRGWAGLSPVGLGWLGAFCLHGRLPPGGGGRRTFSNSFSSPHPRRQGTQGLSWAWGWPCAALLHAGTGWIHVDSELVASALGGGRPWGAVGWKAVPFSRRHVSRTEMNFFFLESLHECSALSSSPGRVERAQQCHGQVSRGHLNLPGAPAPPAGGHHKALPGWARPEAM